MVYVNKNLSAAIICIFVGLLFACIGFLMRSSALHNIATYDETTMGTVTNCSEYTYEDSDGDKHTRYEITVNYKVGDKTYSCKEDGFKSRIALSSEQMVYFASNNPSDAIAHDPKSEDNWTLYLFIGMGCLVVVYGVVIVIVNIVAAIRNKKR